MGMDGYRWQMVSDGRQDPGPSLVERVIAAEKELAQVKALLERYRALAPRRVHLELELPTWEGFKDG